MFGGSDCGKPAFSLAGRAGGEQYIVTVEKVQPGVCFWRRHAPPRRAFPQRHRQPDTEATDLDGGKQARRLLQQRASLDCFSLAYSALASRRMRRSRSASFQSAKNSQYWARLLSCLRWRHKRGPIQGAPKGEGSLPTRRPDYRGSCGTGRRLPFQNVIPRTRDPGNTLWRRRGHLGLLRLEDRARRSSFIASNGSSFHGLQRRLDPARSQVAT